jgi:DNA-binding CsgD family transcriptional regulator
MSVPSDDRMPTVNGLRQEFNLTKSEAEIVIALAEGRCAREIATMRGVSIGTLRAQLRSIFLKTNTRRQSDLLLLILSDHFGNYPVDVPRYKF